MYCLYHSQILSTLHAIPPTDVAPRTRAMLRAHMAALAALAEGLPTYAPLLEASLAAVHAHAEECNALIALIPALKVRYIYMG